MHGSSLKIVEGGHTASNAPDLFRTPNLCGAGPGQCRGGGAPGKPIGFSWLLRHLPWTEILETGDRLWKERILLLAPSWILVLRFCLAIVVGADVEVWGIASAFTLLHSPGPDGEKKHLDSRLAASYGRRGVVSSCAVPSARAVRRKPLRPLGCLPWTWRCGVEVCCSRGPCGASSSSSGRLPAGCGRRGLGDVEKCLSCRPCYPTPAAVDPPPPGLVNWASHLAEQIMVDRRERWLGRVFIGIRAPSS